MSEPKRPARSQALKRITKLAHAGTLRLTQHWLLRERERHFGVADAHAAIDTGRIIEEGEWDPKRSTWKWRIEGRDANGMDFKIIVAYSEKSDVLFLISGMKKERGKWHHE